MKTFAQFTMVTILVLFFSAVYFSQEEAYNFELPPNTAEPWYDTTREIYTVDNKGRVTYRDEVTPNTKQWTKAENFMSDAAVEIVGQQYRTTTSTPKPQTIMIDGQRYYIYYSPNGMPRLRLSR